MPERRMAAGRRLTLHPDPDTGMHRLFAELDPHTATVLRQSLEAIVTRHLCDPLTGPTWKAWTSEERFGHAFAELVDTRAGATGVSIVVHVDLETLKTGIIAAGGVCEYDDGTPLPIGLLRKLACEAEIIPVVLDGDSQPLDVGRARRLATHAQRSAKRAQRRSCEWPGCDHPARWCALHHLDDWNGGGPTDLANLAWFCPAHHTLVHAGWQLRRHGPHLRATPPGHSGRSTP